MVAPLAAGLLLVLNAALQVADAWTTGVALAQGATEYNFASRWIMDTFGFATWATIKGVLVATLLFASVWVRRQDHHLVEQVAVVAALGAGWMAFVVAGNIQKLTM